MAFSMWLFSQCESQLPFEQLKETVESVGQFTFDVSTGNMKNWTELYVLHKNDQRLIGRLDWEAMDGDEVLEKFDHRLEAAEPTCNVLWLRTFLTKVKAVYHWDIYSGVDVDDGWAAIDAVGDEINSDDMTVVYAEFEGWWNNGGDLITWELENPKLSVSHWDVALFRDGQWHRFTLKSADNKAVAQFRKGDVPTNAITTVWPA